MAGLEIKISDPDLNQQIFSHTNGEMVATVQSIRNISLESYRLKEIHIIEYSGR